MNKAGCRGDSVPEARSKIEAVHLRHHGTISTTYPRICPPATEHWPDIVRTARCGLLQHLRRSATGRGSQSDHEQRNATRSSRSSGDYEHHNQQWLYSACASSQAGSNAWLYSFRAWQWRADWCHAAGRHQTTIRAAAAAFGATTATVHEWHHLATTQQTAST